VVEYRSFRNTDPPLLVDLWNTSPLGRGAVQLRSAMLLERYVFSKPYFDPAGLILAQEGDNVLGFGHAGGFQSADGSQAQGVICAILVHPTHRRRGIGSELLRLCENYLTERGAKQLFAGPQAGLNPFYAGLYGGCDTPGFLMSDEHAEPFLRHHNYRVRDVIVVLERKLGQPLRLCDPRLPSLRPRYDVVVGSPRKLGGWWEECTFGCLEPIEMALEDKATKAVAGRILFWEMETFAQQWGKPTIGILRFEIHPDLRGQGLGKLLLTTLIKQMKEQFFELVEVQVSESNLVTLGLCRQLNFETVDRGQAFVKMPTP
jgi:ribosomal protein S18 acetylase RimI-like enzyme